MGGRLVAGKWVTKETWESDSSGEFRRQQSAFRTASIPAEGQRYHLYVSHACPWAHRTLITRTLLGLDEFISSSTVHPLMRDEGWEFHPQDKDYPSSDPLHGCSYLREIYLMADPQFTGRVTVPILWDKKANVLVNNESSDIIRMLSRDFAALGQPQFDLYPESQRRAIDAAMAEFYHPINNGVYRCGFARSATAYATAHKELFEALDHWDTRLKQGPFIFGEHPTIADIALFTTLIRFDPVYYVHFKTSKKHVYEYPNLWRLVRELYALPGVAATVRFDHIRTHYFASHLQLNPLGFVPDGPDMLRLLQKA